MRKLLYASVALALLASAPAHANSYRLSDGSTYSTSCYHSPYGWTCRSWTNGTGNSAKVIAVPTADAPRASEHWADKCHSCEDLDSKPGYRTNEAAW